MANEGSVVRWLFWEGELAQRHEMWKSAKEYSVRTIKTWWSAVSLLLTVAALVFLFLPDSPVPPWAAGIVVLLGLLVAPFGAFHRVRLERDRLKETSEAKPAIEVVPVAEAIADGDDFYLEVKNIGEAAEFAAQIRAREADADWVDPALRLYKGWWKQAHDGTARLNRHQSDRILIARRITGPRTMHLRIFLYGSTVYPPPNDKLDWRESSSWMPTLNDAVLKPQYTLQVDITSNPSLRKPFSKRYELTLGGLAELREPP